MTYRNFHYYSVTFIHFVNPNIFIFRVKPAARKSVFDFKPGQYCDIVNPKALSFYHHYFSITSSSNNHEYLEFCVRVCGPWTRMLSKIKKGDSLFISDPKGSFLLQGRRSYAAFLAGGVGVAPFISMVRSMEGKKKGPEISLLYCSRDPQNIPYADELSSKREKLKVVYIFEQEARSKKGSYQGFLTKNIVKKEIRLDSHPTFFVSGPPEFIRHAQKLIGELGITNHYVRKE